MGLVEVPGHDDEYDTYRSKLTGLFGLVVTVKMLTKIRNVKNEEAEIGCDGLIALNCSFWNGVEGIP